MKISQTESTKKEKNKEMKKITLTELELLSGIPPVESG